MRDLGAEPRLVVPEGLVIDESVRERLARELLLAPADVAGIAAGIAELAPGASYRVHTEWTALESRAPLVVSRVAPVRGAVLVRPDAECVIRDGTVEVEGRVLMDPGAHVHDPHRAIGPLEPASEHGRPPFPRRPVVVFLGRDRFRDPDWLRRLVNRLVRHDVEARIAIPADEVSGVEPSTPAVHLTRPCLPGEMTIRALEPDVVVTLDPTAAAEIDGWCSGDRSTVVVDLDLGLPVPMELVSWQIGRASGRRRARIGRWVDVPAFASLVGRLCAGPHPIPPSDAPELVAVRTRVHEHWTRREPGQGSDGCVVLTGSLDTHARARIDGLADNLEAEGIPAVIARGPASAGDAVPNAASGAALVLLSGLTSTPGLEALIADRKRAGLPTAVDLGMRDLEPDDAGMVAQSEPRLTGPAVALGEACGLVVAPPGARFAAAGAIGARAIDLPTLLTRARVAALRGARTSVDPTGVLVIGWRLGAGGDPAPAYAGAVGDGIARILTEHRDRVEIVGDAERVPAGLRGHERVTVIPDVDVDPETIAGWAVHVWTPALLGAEILDDARLLEEASCAGVASIMPAAAAVSGVDGFVSSHVLVASADDADDWYSALHHVLDDPVVRAVRAHEAARRADALDDLAIAKAVVSRFIGRARHRTEGVGS